MKTYFLLLSEFTVRMGEYHRIHNVTQRERLKDGTEMPEGHVCTQRYALHLNYVPKIQTNKTIPHRNGRMEIRGIGTRTSETARCEFSKPRFNFQQGKDNRISQYEHRHYSVICTGY